MAIPQNYESTCQNLIVDIRNIRTRIEVLEREITINQSTLDRGIENRVRMIIENGQIHKVPTLSDQEIQVQTQRLQTKLKMTKTN